MWVKAILQSERGTHVGWETKCQTKKKKKKAGMLWIRPHVHKDLFMHTHRCSQIYFCMQVRSNVSTNETLMGTQRQKVQTDFFRKWTKLLKIKNKFTKNRIWFWKQIKVCSSFVVFIPFLFPDKKYPDQTTFLRANLSQNSLQAKTATSQPSRKCSKPPALWGWFKG